MVYISTILPLLYNNMQFAIFLVHPMTCHEGTVGESRYSSTLSLTLVIDGVGGERFAFTASPQGISQYPQYRTLVWKISTPPADPQPVQLAARRYADYIILAHTICCYVCNIIS